MKILYARVAADGRGGGRAAGKGWLRTSRLRVGSASAECPQMSAFGRFWLLPIGASTHAIAADGGGLARGRIATTAWTGRGGLWAAAASFGWFG